MKKRLLYVLCGCTLAFTLPVYAGHEEGIRAYQAGDYVTAYAEFLPLAKQGDATVQNSLGVMYEKGQGVPQSDAQAAAWFRKAAEQGYAAAQYNLGVMYLNGLGVPQDYAQALIWYRKAAEQGVAAAQYNLGVMYLNGRGVPRSPVVAYALWRNLASLGDEELGKLSARITPAQIAEGKVLAVAMAKEKNPLPALDAYLQKNESYR